MKSLHPHRRPRRHRRYRFLSASLLVLLGFGLGIISLRVQVQAAGTDPDLCQALGDSQAVLSRQQLTQLLTVPERANRQAIDAIAEAPYCTLTTMEVRAGVMAERTAYPLAFDPQTWLILLYENEEYVGYDFKLHH